MTMKYFKAITIDYEPFEKRPSNNEISIITKGG